VTPEAAFGQVLQELRRDKRLSQQKLADAADCHRTYVSLIERGKFSPSINLVFRLAAALDLTPSQLLAKVEKQVQSREES